MRYFLEVSYKGTHFHGFQIQEKSTTVQGEVEKALALLFRKKIDLTGSSRTDAGVHALQNYFHFDSDERITERYLYNLNAMISPDIVIHTIKRVQDDAHCRFDAIARKYRYFIYANKDPFQKETAWYYPFKLDFQLLQSAAEIILGAHDFSSFSKRNTQVFTHDCTISKALWTQSSNGLAFEAFSNRFLRGMVRALVATMLKVGRGTISLQDFENILAIKDCTKADFSAPGKGLFLMEVQYPEGIFLS